jgi:hypothetical protein
MTACADAASAMPAEASSARPKLLSFIVIASPLDG